MTAPKLAEPLREGQPRWAVVAAGASTLARAKGATAAAKLADVGLYTVTFDRDVSACALQATIADPGTTALATGGEVGAWRSASDPKVVTVRTADSTGAATNALPFHLTVLLLSGGRSRLTPPFLIVATQSAAGGSRAVRVP